MSLSRSSSLFIFLCASFLANAQHFHLHREFSRADSLKGSITLERAWWDVKHYDLSVKVDLDKRYISGTNKITYEVIENGQVMQIDLQPPMSIYEVEQNGEKIYFSREGNVYWIPLPGEKNIGSEAKIAIHFDGTPKVAVRPPWDGGFTWTEDERGHPFIATSNQGIGASIWWPLKDHPSDEPDNGMLISVRAPDTLMDVSNGRLVKEEQHNDGTKTWHWKVVNPINNYGVNINLGNYIHFGEKYEGEKGILDMDYYVLEHNEIKAREHFKDARRTLEALEYWFGPYPFYEDGYKLVEAPYLGMEHQSSVTYGNGYQNGYKGTDLSGSGWGLKFDFIIIHETGHEWFANNITYTDVADMWIHESFTNYSESLFVEYFYGPQAGNEYVIGTRLNIQNDIPIIGAYGVDNRGSGDMYYKGGNMLHTIRQVIDDDILWRSILRGLNEEFYHQVVTTQEIEKYIITESGKDLSKIFDQYLRDIRIPTLEYTFKNGLLMHRWMNAVPGFNMPIKVSLDGQEGIWLHPTSNWQRMESSAKTLSVDANFYVGSLNTLGN